MCWGGPMHHGLPGQGRTPASRLGTGEISMSQQTYSISELASELEVTTRTIRFYEEQGMLAPTRRGQERIYSPKDRVTLQQILRGQRIGVSLAECKKVVRLYDPGAGNRNRLQGPLGLIAERRLELERQPMGFGQKQLELDTAEERCLKALQATADQP